MSFLDKLKGMFGGGHKDSTEAANLAELKQKIGEAAAGGTVSQTPTPPQSVPGISEAPAGFGPAPAQPTTQPQPTPQQQTPPSMANTPAPAPFPGAQPAAPTPAQPPVQPGQPNGPQQ